ARPWRDVAGQAQPAFRAGGADGSLFTLVRGGWANPAGSPRASLQRVRYGLEDGKLVRHGAVMLDGTDDGPGTVLLSGIASARLRLLGPNGWQEGWSGSALPRALELTLAGPELGEVRQLLLVGTGGAA
uniref:type II secretion system protein GspJ n=1 Tax=Sandarakinorhabdus rubra TaxID=2672568 RepID=UPI001969B0BB